MKRLAVMFVLVSLVLGAAFQASAAEIKARGDWYVYALWTNNHDFIDKQSGAEVLEDDFNVIQRARVWFDFIANENLKAVLGIEIGDLTWGTSRSIAGVGIVGPGSGGQIGADGVNIETKHAYLDFNLPGTKVNMKVGIQPVVLPNQLGSAILDDDVAAAVLSVPFNENITAALGYARAWNRDNTSSTQGKLNDEYDVAFLLLPLNFKGFSVTPFFALGWLGQDAAIDMGSYINKKDSNPWWLGLSVNVSALDPFVFMLDFNYGGMDDKSVNNVKFAQNGWFLDAAIDWKLGFMTPELFFVYGSGDDNKLSNGSERMPTISPDYQATTFLFDGTNFGTGANMIIDPTGKWAIGLAFKDVTFVKNLTHTLRIMYASGTNSKDSPFKSVGGLAFNKYLTSKDSLVEVNFDHQYMLYENLAAIVEIGYINLNIDSGAWGQAVKDAISSDAWKLAIGFRYKF